MAVRQPVALVHANGTVATVLGVNVSMGGLQVTCDRYTLDALLPSSAAAGAVSIGTAIDAHFKLPLNEGLTKLDMSCRVAYVTGTEGGGFLVGLEFSGASQSGHAALAAFLEEALAYDLA